MNNVPTPTTPADPHRISHGLQEDDADGPAQSAVSEQNRDGSATTQNPSLSQAAKEGLTKKLQFMIHLSISLDTLVYAELCALYYMDCSFFRLMIRWVPQALFISPKAEDTILIIPNYHVSAIIGPNFLCTLMHLIASLPEAGEASRGYLHGGILFDFIGQKAPSSKFSLLLLDLLIFGLQCVMLTVNMEKERVRKALKPPTLLDNSDLSTTTSSSSQDYDAEERGVLRDAPIVDETHDIEMQSLGSGNGGHQHNVEERVGLLRRTTTPTDNLESLADTLRSGNAVLANFNVRQSLRTAWHNRANSPESAAAYAIQNVGYNATLAALAAQRRARLAATQPRQP
ncbi:DUF1746-domain-containing protein [Annulohypoxylon maeteangense]|uniref:DUF1746-domain-containing protein n=1 Tax=Annulohypoxylon maeteangense TaxID=1927788 RepID=UPI00200794F1|nr:DUF1746-domain-containing protein [Annulohypoxylon maeteangense]KAI0889991.1 DUF1746-domain-containing protein [Annulohypoxylon maeteangense]